MPYRETPKVRERKAAQQQSILRCAEAVVREKGFAGLTVQEIAQQAGIGVGTVYRYFPAKDALAVEVFRRATEREVAALSAALAPPGTVQIRLARGIAVFAERALKAPGFAWSLIAEPAEPAVDAARNEYRRQYSLLFARLLEDGVREGRFPIQDTTLSAAAIVGGLAEALLGPLREDREPYQVISQLQTLCLRAVGAPADHE